MNKLLFTIIILLCSYLSFAQVAKVQTQLDSSFVNVKKSWTSANNAIKEIQKCNLSTSLNDLQFNAAKAKSAIDEAMSLAEKAETEADGAEGEAFNINCTEVKEVATKAENAFKKAKGKFDDASSGLGSITYEDNISMIIDYLNVALNDISKGMNNLKKGTEELQVALNKLSNCK